MNRQIRRLGVALLVCYIALFAMLNYWQVIGADDLIENPRNTRAVVRDFNKARGSILTADDVVLAQSDRVDVGQFEYERRYLEPELYAHITGYFSFALGATGVEKEYNDELAGRTLEQQIRSLGDVFVEQDRVGDVTLTVRDDVQKQARDALGIQEGSVVVLDPRDGAILGMWSFPSYDPNLLSSLDTQAAIDAKLALEDAPGDPLLGHAYQVRYFPGSTFKIVTAAAGLESGLVTVDEPVYPTVREFTPPQTNRPIGNFGGSACGGALLTVLAKSCNSAFAQMAIDVGPEGMIDEAEEFGFNDTPPIDLPDAVESVFPTSFDQNLPALAQSGIGQNEVQASPLEMALVAAAVANGGEIMAPHVMRDVRDGEGELIDEYEPEVWRTPMSPDDAAILRQAMLGVVEGGTATRLAISGFEVGAKTGTAEIGSGADDTHAWVVGFAGRPGAEPEVAFAVFIEAKPGQGQQAGGSLAAPLAKLVIERVLEAP